MDLAQNLGAPGGILKCPVRMINPRSLRTMIGGCCRRPLDVAEGTPSVVVARDMKRGAQSVVVARDM